MTDSGEQPLEIEVRVAARSDRGQVRERNEDAVLIGNLEDGEVVDLSALAVAWTSPRPLFVLCDGMGGMAGGEVASELAADAIWSEMRAAHPSRERDVVARTIRRAVRKANRRIRERARKQPELRGMGTTVSAAALAGPTLVLAQVGDSRAYLRRQGEMVQITRDQSLVSALVAAGRLTAAEAQTSDHRSVVLQALGAQADVVVSLPVCELRAGDRLLLCSDGLHGVVADAAIAHALAEAEPAAACERLIGLAGQAGAPDNVSVIIADFSGAGLGEAVAGEAPTFTELDPGRPSAEAVTHTSRVARRLAARAGLIEETDTEEVPATGIFPTVAAPAAPEPARKRLDDRTRLGLLPWLMAAAVVALALLWLWLA